MAAELLAAARDAGLLDPDGRQGALGPATLAAYLAMPGEPDPVAVCAQVRAAGGLVLLPRPVPGRGLEWARDDGVRGVAEAPIRVPVPTAPTVGAGAEGLIRAAVAVVLLPALAVDVDGRRLGQGGGYYDRLLAALAEARTAGASGPRLVAVVHDEEVLERGVIPVDVHDEPVDAALTPSGLRAFD